MRLLEKVLRVFEDIRINMDYLTGAIEVFGKKKVVSKVTKPEQEVSLAEAQEIDPDVEEGQLIELVITPKDFGRIAAQMARQIINQKLKMAERDVIYEEFRHRVGEIISGTVKRFIRGSDIVIDLGKVEGNHAHARIP